MDEAGANGHAPLARVLVAVGLALEALAVAVLGGGVVVVAVRDQAADRAGAIALGLTSLVLAAGIAAVAAGVARGASWSRSPALVWQLLQAFVALSGTAGPQPVAVALVALAVAVAGGLFRHDVIPRDE